jgi:hypothetical protein
MHLSVILRALDNTLLPDVLALVCTLSLLLVRHVHRLPYLTMRIVQAPDAYVS